MTKWFIFHPGEHIAEGLQERWRSQKFLAKLIHKTPQEVNHIITWKRNINADWAYRLSAAFWTSAQLWMKLQSKYDLVKIEEKNWEKELYNKIKLSVDKQTQTA